MKNFLKIIGLLVLVLVGTSRLHGQQSYDAQISVIGQVFPQSDLTGPGNIVFKVQVDYSSNAVGIPLGNLKVYFAFPPQITIGTPIIKNRTSNGAFPPIYTYVPSSVFDMQFIDGSNEGYFLNNVNLPAGQSVGTYEFTLPFSISAPMPLPSGYLVEVSLDPLSGGTNTLLYSAPFATYIMNTVRATNPVPVIFNHFTATSKSCEAQLEWSVAKELGAEVYHIERSADGKEFATIAKVNYNSEAKGNYVFSDKEVLKGNNIYRIKAVDPDGTSLLSDVQRLTFDCDQTNILMYPNPTASGVTISGLAAGQRITLYDLTGRMLINKKVNNAEEQLDLSNYAAAMYKVVITTAEGTVIYSNKLAKQ